MLTGTKLRIESVIQVIVLLFGMGVAWGLLNAKLDLISDTLLDTKSKVEYIDHYLEQSSKGDFQPPEHYEERP